MVVLRMIGRFFARIGRWIRDTAWVQPLLIVGGIFAIIFSIPYITNWVKSWGASSTTEVEKFYNKNKLSLKGCDEKNSDADKMFQYLVALDDNDEEGIEAGKKKFGEKFFLCFVQDGCSGCENNYEGLNYLKSNYTTKDETSDLYLADADFKYYTIHTDETVDDLDYNNIFEHFIIENYQQVFETLAGTFSDEQNYPYLVNQGGKSSTYYTNINKLAETVETPTIFLVDTTNNANITTSEFGVTEIVFAAQGKDNKSTSLDKAMTFADCWNHADIFSEDYKD